MENMAIVEKELNKEFTAVMTSDLEVQADNLCVFNVSLYKDLFDQAVDIGGLNNEEARDMVRWAVLNDSVGVVTEKISGEKDKSGRYFFDTETRIRLQMTPPEHFYLKDCDPQTGEEIMRTPEHSWGGYKKDISQIISSWRRGLDRESIKDLRSILLHLPLSNEEIARELELGEVIMWASCRGEEWEGPQVMKFNGQYGYFYVAAYEELDGEKRLRVHDFKTDLNPGEYQKVIEDMGGELHQNPHYAGRPLLEKVMTSKVRVTEEWSDEKMWRKLAAAKDSNIGEIFGLPVETIIALQDRELHERVRVEVAAPIADWISEVIYQDGSLNEVQRTVRRRFIESTQELLEKIKKERELIQGNLDRTAYGVPHKPFYVLSDRIYRDSLDPTILVRYTGSSGDSCGVWGEDDEGILDKPKITSVETLKKLLGFTNGYGKENSRRCIICGEVNPCLERCAKCNGEVEAT